MKCRLHHIHPSIESVVPSLSHPPESLRNRANTARSENRKASEIKLFPVLRRSNRSFHGSQTLPPALPPIPPLSLFPVCTSCGWLVILRWPPCPSACYHRPWEKGGWSGHTRRSELSRQGGGYAAGLHPPWAVHLHHELPLSVDIPFLWGLRTKLGVRILDDECRNEGLESQGQTSRSVR
ncbi:hypothetical protein CSOJ01_05209 [Colletotrichum sojae]|uniref:Uncharacterized protein n=1 Tax=Colletotrichum sojae TaxID=2175907 RepID=A0A8H6JFU2_9PEZI|nr:hypothetical protein CSOJ01_05209 [Colletotrichum sojae]